MTPMTPYPTTRPSRLLSTPYEYPTNFSLLRNPNRTVTILRSRPPGDGLNTYPGPQWSNPQDQGENDSSSGDGINRYPGSQWGNPEGQGENSNPGGDGLYRGDQDQDQDVDQAWWTNAQAQQQGESDGTDDQQWNNAEDQEQGESDNPSGDRLYRGDEDWWTNAQE
ncbi:hypothetical protein BCR34DRAFT_572354 [Clohesyomyces aquaticus]|uniref:Uncharacterized protein n=1 Tax=Clohesyomyces aquaticus TaxID=1231657 RepID=A0A1Y1Z439_9PLEO|nr:hypothetical protein BCR34DRAFT_572354 [Clohesyomyces aquaticus]